MIEDLQRKLNERADAKLRTFQNTQEQLLYSAMSALGISLYATVEEVLKPSGSATSVNLYFLIILLKQTGEAKLRAEYRKKESDEFIKSVEDAKTQLEELQNQVDSLSQ